MIIYLLHRAESSKDVLRRWQAMWALHRANPELGLHEQVEATDMLDADSFTRLRLLLLEKGDGAQFDS